MQARKKTMIKRRYLFWDQQRFRPRGCPGRERHPTTRRVQTPMCLEPAAWLEGTNERGWHHFAARYTQETKTETLGRARKGANTNTRAGWPCSERVQ